MMMVIMMMMMTMVMMMRRMELRMELGGLRVWGVHNRKTNKARRLIPGPFSWWPAACWKLQP